MNDLFASGGQIRRRHRKFPNHYVADVSSNHGLNSHGLAVTNWHVPLDQHFKEKAGRILVVKFGTSMSNDTRNRGYVVEYALKGLLKRTVWIRKESRELQSLWHEGNARDGTAAIFLCHV